jgi:hypothetical protein
VEHLKNNWHSLEEATDGSCEKKKKQARYYMYSQEYSPLVQFMQVLGPPNKKPRVHKSPAKEIRESAEWGINPLEVQDEGVVFKSNRSNPSKVDSIDYRTSGEGNNKKFMTLDP